MRLISLVGWGRRAKPHLKLLRHSIGAFGHLNGEVRFSIVQNERLVFFPKWAGFSQFA